MKQPFLPDRTAYMELAIKMRGEVIGAVIDLELVIDQYIANHFTLDSDKNKEFKKIFIWDAHLGLTRKIEILSYIITTHDKDLLQAQPNILIDLKEIKDCRNKMAHTFLDATSDTIRKNKSEQKITFKTFKSTSKIGYSPKRIKEIVDKAHGYTTALIYWHPYKIWETVSP